MTGLFDQTLKSIRDRAEIGRAMNGLIEGLHALRTACSEREWRTSIVPKLRTHALYPVLLEDPFVRHSAVRPRGYAGDAELLDFIYGGDNIRSRLAQSSVLGRELYQFSSATSITQAVRNRLHLSAAEIDSCMRFTPRPRVTKPITGSPLTGPQQRA